MAAERRFRFELHHGIEVMTRLVNPSLAFISRFSKGQSPNRSFPVGVNTALDNEHELVYSLSNRHALRNENNAREIETRHCSLDHMKCHRRSVVCQKNPPMLHTPFQQNWVR